MAGFLTGWLEAKRKHVASSTFEGYRKIITMRLVPQFGEVMVVDFKRKALKDWLDTLEVGNKTLSNIQSCLRSALNDAVDEEILELNPLAGWTYARKEAPAREDDVDPFTPEEQRAILASATGQARNLIQFALWTGMRTSELVALDWGDVDWLRGEIRVSKAMTQAAGGEAEVTKTTSGRRSIKLLAPAMEALKAQKAFTFLADAEVFQNPRTLERWAGDQPISRSADQENDVGARPEKNGCPVPAALPDPSHVCLDDALGRRASDVGCPADGAQGLDDDRAHLWSLDACSERAGR